MLLNEIVGNLPLTSKAKNLLLKNTKDFFICLNTVTGGKNYTKDYVDDINCILTKLYNLSCMEIDFNTKHPNGIFKITSIDMDDDYILPNTKEQLLRDRKQVDWNIDLTIKCHNQDVFKSDTTTPFDTLVALKYLHKKIQSAERGVEFALSLSDVARLMRTKHCYYTGVALELEGARGLTFDRIDSTKGYVKGNVIACSAIANSLKENLMESGEVQSVLTNKQIKKMLLKFSELM